MVLPVDLILEVMQQFYCPRQSLPIQGKGGREMAARVPDQHPWLPPVVSFERDCFTSKMLGSKCTVRIQFLVVEDL